MAKVIDLRHSDGDLVLLGRSLVLPNSNTDSQPQPLNGALRFNTTVGLPQVFHNGAWVTLGTGTGTVEGTSNNHTHAMSQIIGLVSALSGKAPLIHSHAISDVNGLSTALVSKADAIHGHAMGDISGLEASLGSKAASVHSHNLVVKETVSGCFPGNPPAQFAVTWTAGVTTTFPAHLVGSYITVATNPTTVFVISVKKGTATVGTINISPSGTITFNLGTDLTVNAGETLSLVLPARDLTISTISFTLVGTRPTQSTL